MADDGFLLVSDTSKTTTEKETWGPNADERTRQANAGQGLSKNAQWLRKISLVVYDEKGGKDSESGIEFSALRVTSRQETDQPDTQFLLRVFKYKHGPGLR